MGSLGRVLGRFLVGSQVGLLVLFFGCAAPLRVADTREAVVVCDSDRLWEACQAALKGRGFELDVVDRRSGVIETHSRVSGQWFEFWSGDIEGGSNLAESSLQTVRRRVRLELGEEVSGRCHLSCQVLVERLESQPREVSGTVRSREVLSQSSGNLPGLRAGRRGVEVDAVWTVLGEDGVLSGAILDGILGCQGGAI